MQTRHRKGVRRAAASASLRILWVDHAVPDPALGAGFPRLAAIIRALVADGRRVTCFPVTSDAMRSTLLRRALPRGVEIVAGGIDTDLSAYLAQRGSTHDLIWVSRTSTVGVMARA